MKKLVRVTVFSFLLGVSASAQQSDIPASKEKVVKLVETLRLKETMHSVMTHVQQSTMQSIEKMMPTAPSLTNEQKALAAEMQTEMLKVLSVEDMIDDLIPVYQKHFTDADIDALLQFYASPVGRKFLDKQGVLIQEGSVVSDAHMQKKMPALQALMNKYLERMKATIKTADPVTTK